MSAPVLTLPLDATAGDAALLMAQRGIRHVVVTDEVGVAMGVLSERDLFAMQRLSLRRVGNRLREAAIGIFSLADTHGVHSADSPDEWIHAALQAIDPSTRKLLRSQLWSLAWKSPESP